MKKQEFMELFETANRAAKSVKDDKFSPKVSMFKDVMKRMKQAPESLVRYVIRTVFVGKSLNLFRNHKNPQIRSGGRLLCTHFMRILYTQGRESRCVKETSVKTKSNSVNKTGDSKPVKVREIKTLTDSMKTGDSKRDRVREILQTSLTKVANEVVETEMKKRVTVCDPSLVAASVESAMFKNLGCFMGSQKAKYRSILFNMDDSNNPDLRRKVLVGEISGERLVTMKTEEMGSEKIQEEVRKIKEKARFREEDRLKMFQSEHMIMA